MNYKKTIIWPNGETVTDELNCESYEDLCMLAIAAARSLPSGCVVSYAVEDFTGFGFKTI